jgi:hypothetical protein
MRQKGLKIREMFARQTTKQEERLVMKAAKPNVLPKFGKEKQPDEPALTKGMTALKLGKKVPKAESRPRAVTPKKTTVGMAPPGSSSVLKPTSGNRKGQGATGQQKKQTNVSAAGQKGAVKTRTATQTAAKKAPKADEDKAKKAQKEKEEKAQSKIVEKAQKEKEKKAQAEINKALKAKAAVTKGNQRPKNKVGKLGQVDKAAKPKTLGIDCLR